MKIITDTATVRPDLLIERIAPAGELLFFDIETTGLKKETTQVYLIGCAFFDGVEWNVRQYLAESALDEVRILREFADFASGFSTLVHFNGDGFDIPYLAYKYDYHQLDFDFSSFRSVDIYKSAKPLKKLLGLERMNQKSIERFLGIAREDKMGGGELIPVYYDYERTGSAEAEYLLLQHNYDDIQGMMQLLPILSYLQLQEGDFVFKKAERIGQTAVLEFRLSHPLPVSFETYADDEYILIASDGDLLQLNIKIYEGVARLPLPDVENYVYLPEEDCVIHKDVAAFVDRKHKRKATAKNCFLKKEGCFLPQKRELFTPAFLVENEKKKTFFEWEPADLADEAMMKRYALEILHF